MATKKTTKKKQIHHRAVASVKKVHRYVMENTLESVAYVSIFLNVFFLTGIVLFQHSDSFQQKVFEYVTANYCDGSSDGLVQAEYDLQCRDGDFGVYYDKAVKDYEDLLKRRSY